MFGLEDQQKKKPADAFVFDLEKELKDPKRLKELVNHVDEKIQKIKNQLRSGDNKEDFERYALILQGYAAMMKVFGRTAMKSKK